MWSFHASGRGWQGMRLRWLARGCDGLRRILFEDAHALKARLAAWLLKAVTGRLARVTAFNRGVSGARGVLVCPFENECVRR